MSSLIAWILRAIPFGTIIMYGALGETLTEKSGNLNLGVPGIMYLGGFAGFASAYYYEKLSANPSAFVCVILALLCALIASALGGLIYAFLTITLRANQNVTGLALTTFGMGVANFFGVFILNGASYTAAPLAYKAFSAMIPVLSGLGVVGKVLFSYGFLAYAAIVLAVVLHWFFTRTRAGLNLRAVGENPATADAAGINVTLYKYVATCTGAAICGVGGLYYVLDYNQGIWATTGQIEVAFDGEFPPLVGGASGVGEVVGVTRLRGYLYGQQQVAGLDQIGVGRDVEPSVEQRDVGSESILVGGFPRQVG